LGPFSNKKKKRKKKKKKKKKKKEKKPFVHILNGLHKPADLNPKSPRPARGVHVR
jgi:hypothetical protein